VSNNESIIISSYRGRGGSTGKKNITSASAANIEAIVIKKSLIGKECPFAGGLFERFIILPLL
jgi:hypothetical protein